MAMHPVLQQPAAATTEPRPLTSGRDARFELQLKEQEVSQLRIAALRALEHQVLATGAPTLCTGIVTT